MEGYHSPQIDVDVRLNTNEAPGPPPTGFTAALGRALDDIDWHRYPDRAYTALRTAVADLHGVAPEQVFAAGRRPTTSPGCRGKPSGPSPPSARACRSWR
jgi:histidinol-phosphate aminotransferase